MNIKLKYVNRQRLVALALAGTLSFSLVGCSEEMAAYNGDVDILDTNLEDVDSLASGVKQELDVKGEDFKLVINYYCGEKDWTITSDKTLHMSICTKGLNSSKEVYIDDIHMDTSIVSDFAYFNGIKQDTLDDGVHNALMLGFPISDTSSYYGTNVIEGQNSDFIEGTYYAYSGYGGGGSTTQKRYLESDYLSKGVWANDVVGVVGLVIHDTVTDEIRCVDVDTTLRVTVNNQITFYENGNYVTYEYDRNGNKKEISSSKENPKTLVKQK